MTGEMVAHEARVISDWSGVLIHALSQGDRARAAKAAATIAAAARTASFILDPQQAISPAVTSSNGHYITPEGAHCTGCGRASAFQRSGLCLHCRESMLLAGDEAASDA